jgi:DNA sulfur modification protein DndD
MIFRHVSFRNFRLLRDLHLEFSTDPERKLTVIRAENETGKTTILTGLQWILFGDEALPRSAEGYRLHPVDEVGSDVPVEIEGELEFEHTYERRARSGDWIGHTEVYLARRRAIDAINEGGKWTRRSTSFDLSRRTDAGWEPVPGDAQLELRQILGSNLKDLFFTDGDRALSFITSDMTVGEKRKLVQSAIRDMLGFGILESAKAHVQRATTTIRGDVEGGPGTDDLAEKARQMESRQQRVERAESTQAEAEADAQRIAIDVAALETRIDAALRHGDREELADKLGTVKKEVERTRKELDGLRTQHSELFRRVTLGHAVAAAPLRRARSMLDALSVEGRLPRSATPILRERLKIGRCICSRDLMEGSPEREAVERLIAEQETRSAVDDRLTSLRYAAEASLRELDGNLDWLAALRMASQQREDAEARLRERESEQKRLEAAIDALPDTDVGMLRKTLRDFQRSREAALKRAHVAESEATSLKNELQKLTSEYEVLTRRNKAATRVRARLAAADDVRRVLVGAYEAIEQHEVPAVSESMNTYFMEMIGGDPQRTIIREAAVTSSYDIVVLGPMQRRLDPDTDINGASRRALTLAFILALTEVSGVKAPNVIDTPLGMMSPQIKRAALETAVRHSEQLILLLTRSEIRDIELLIDQYAGAYVTLSNSAHHPRWLANDPGVQGFASLPCSCNHREYCSLCERLGDADRSDLVRRGS